MKGRKNLPIFVPNVGCPNMCSFCDQRAITGKSAAPTPAEVTRLCEEGLPQNGENFEIAFFGGSFTAIEKSYMCALLEAAKPFTEAGRAAGIRLSTRPDAIDAGTVEYLKSMGVRAIELGAQSMDDAVLEMNRRGHTAADVQRAAEIIKASGIELGLQMMVGLYGEKDNRAAALHTARCFSALGADCVRIYPTVVMKNTLLERLMLAGEYTPITDDEAADICGELLEYFSARGIRVLRTGLQSDESLRENAVAGAMSASIGEMARSRAVGKKIFGQLDGIKSDDIIIYVSAGMTSAAAGYRRENRRRLEGLGIKAAIREDSALLPFEVRIVERKGQEDMGR